MTRTLTVAAIQQHCHEDKSASLELTARHVRAAAREGAELVCLQELHATHYFCQTEEPRLFDLAEELNGPTTQALACLAKELNIVIVGSIFERRAAGLYHNTAVVLERNGQLAGFYRKMHIPDDPGFYEKFYFTPGDTDAPGLTPIRTSVGTLGVLVCWDQWYPEAARLMALKGADLLIYPTAIGWDPRDDEAEQLRQQGAWETVQRGHAVANGLPVVSINRVGHEPDPSGQSEGIRFWGHSFIAGPQGEVLAMADEHNDTVLLHTLDLRHSEDVRRIWPFLRDRRVEAYPPLAKRWLGDAL